MIGWFVKKVLLWLLAVAIGFGWFWYNSKDLNYSVSETEVPEQIWEGGAQKIKIQVENSSKGLLRFSVEGPDLKEKDELRWHDSQEEVSPGESEWIVYFPESVHYGSVEWEVLEASAGDSIQWKVFLNDEIIDEKKVDIDKPIGEPNSVDFHPVFLYAEFDQNGVIPLEDY